MGYNHDIEIVNKVLKETEELIERERLEERFLQRQLITNKQFQQPLIMSQSKIKYFESKLVLLREIIKEKSG